MLDSLSLRILLGESHVPPGSVSTERIIVLLLGLVLGCSLIRLGLLGWGLLLGRYLL